ncbi:MAG: response regulator transcription factor [Nitrospinae bacterium]|nr:response regulator transcription factor [Nitrospinota bacterium]
MAKKEKVFSDGVIKVAVIEDDEALAEALRVRLTNDERTTVVGVFTSAEQGASALEALKPNVILVDLGLPGISGIDLIAGIKWKMDGVRIMVLTASDDHETVFKALRAGADGYLLKEDNLEKIADYVMELQNGGAPMNPGIARAIVSEFHGSKPSKDNPLTKSEMEIIGLLVEGMSYKEIASERGVSWHTVNAHVRNIYDKLQASGRHEAITKARAAGIITHPK